MIMAIYHWRFYLPRKQIARWSRLYIRPVNTIRDTAEFNLFLLKSEGLPLCLQSEYRVKQEGMSLLARCR